MNSIRIICRQSRLSLLQAEMVKNKILEIFPDKRVEITGRSSRGDKEINRNLATLDGTDFFTEDIFDALGKEEADIAVHSLKDMSASHFFSHSAFAVVDKEDARDVVIFNASVVEKIKSGAEVVVGTCSPRREEMAVKFLARGLPQFNPNRSVNVTTKAIRGNVEVRLQQLNDARYDGIILATAGLNRLLRSEADRKLVAGLLSKKKLMLLPLIECVPAPCQGAIVAEAHPNNEEAVELISRINDPYLFDQAYAEKKLGAQYGIGCLQKFGVTTLRTSVGETLFAAGEDTSGRHFQYWQGLPEIDLDEDLLFSSTDYMKDFFDYKWDEGITKMNEEVVFIANQKAATNLDQVPKTVIASGTKTWIDLANKGVWVTASADGLGFEQLLPALKMPLLNIKSNDICILTHTAAAKRWREKGYTSTASYELIDTHNQKISRLISDARYIFWSSYGQYSSYKDAARPDAIHMCAAGETSTLLKQDGRHPIIFPTIKAFEQWRRIHIQSLSEG